jgi:hypothetical protein
MEYPNPSATLFLTASLPSISPVLALKSPNEMALKSKKEY